MYFPRQLLCLAKKSREQSGLSTSNLTHHGNEWPARDIHIDTATNYREKQLQHIGTLIGGEVPGNQVSAFIGLAFYQAQLSFFAAFS